jgi:hypothetical protein
MQGEQKERVRENLTAKSMLFSPSKHISGQKRSSKLPKLNRISRKQIDNSLQKMVEFAS